MRKHTLSKVNIILNDYKSILDDEISGVELISLTEEDKKEEVYIEKHIVQKIIDFHQSFKLESDEKESLV